MKISTRKNLAVNDVHSYNSMRTQNTHCACSQSIQVLDSFDTEWAIVLISLVV